MARFLMYLEDGATRISWCKNEGCERQGVEADCGVWSLSNQEDGVVLKKRERSRRRRVWE